MKPLNKYKPSHALRPFSLIVAVVSCSLGILLAYLEGFTHPLNAFIVMTAGLLAQAGINLINDLEDLKLIKGNSDVEQQAVHLIKLSGRLGFICIGISALMAIPLVWQHGWPLFALILLSGLFSLTYNFGSHTAKSLGLSMLLVFLLMGVLMVQGAYMAISGQFSALALWLSVPTSILVSLLLLSNELRDYVADQHNGIRTFTVRFGINKAARFYLWMLAVAFLSAVAVTWYFGSDAQPNWLGLAIMACTLPFVWPVTKRFYQGNFADLPPLTGRFFGVFTLAYELAIFAHF